MSLLDIIGDIGGLFGNHSQQKNTQAGIDATNNLFGDARNQALQWQQQGVQNQAPYTGLGANAVGVLNKLYGFGTGANGANGAPDLSAFQADPGYQFQLNQGIAANNASYAAKGLSDSGAAQKALAGYTTGLANQSYGDYVNRLMGLVGVGENATSNLNSNNLGYTNALFGAAGNQAGLLNSAYGTLGNQQAQMWQGATHGVNDIFKSLFGG